MDGTSNTLMIGEVLPILSSFWNGVVNDLQLGAYGEDYRRCFVKSWSTSGDADDRPAEFFGYNTLLDLTSQSVTSEQKAAELKGYLLTAVQHAAQSDKPGEQAAMNAYVNGVAAAAVQNPSPVTPLSAQILRAMGFAGYPW